MRVFVAFDLSIRTVENLVLLQEDLANPISALGARVRWTEASNIHLTLRFLGDLDASLVYRSREVLRAVAEELHMFEMETKGTGCFPDMSMPRIIWAGVSEGIEAVQNLEQEISKHLEEIGIARDDRDFSAHTTIGRLKTPEARIDAAELLGPYSETVFGTTQVKDFALFESSLTPRGAVYRVIERFPLKVS